MIEIRPVGADPDFRQDELIPPHGTGEGTDAEVTFNPKDRNRKIENMDGTFGRDPHFGLAHELIHARNIMQGVVDPTEVPVALEGKNRTLYIPNLQREVLNTIKEDNLIRGEHGKASRLVPKELNNEGQ